MGCRCTTGGAGRAWDGGHAGVESTVRLRNHVVYGTMLQSMSTDLGEVVGAEEEARPEVDGQVRAGGGRAGEDVHAVVEDRSDVGAYVGEPVDQQQRAERGVSVESRVVRGHVGAVAVAEEVERLAGVELLGPVVAHVLEHLRQA
jgi:hypothetical protein